MILTRSDFDQLSMRGATCEKSLVLLIFSIGSIPQLYRKGFALQSPFSLAEWDSKI